MNTSSIEITLFSTLYDIKKYYKILNFKTIIEKNTNKKKTIKKRLFFKGKFDGVKETTLEQQLGKKIGNIQLNTGNLKDIQKNDDKKNTDTFHATTTYSNKHKECFYDIKDVNEALQIALLKFESDEKNLVVEFDDIQIPLVNCVICRVLSYRKILDDGNDWDINKFENQIKKNQIEFEKNSVVKIKTNNKNPYDAIITKINDDGTYDTKGIENNIQNTLSGNYIDISVNNLYKIKTNSGDLYDSGDLYGTITKINNDGTYSITTLDYFDYYSRGRNTETYYNDIINYFKNKDGSKRKIFLFAENKPKHNINYYNLLDSNKFKLECVNDSENCFIGDCSKYDLTFEYDFYVRFMRDEVSRIYFWQPNLKLPVDIFSFLQNNRDIRQCDSYSIKFQKLSNQIKKYKYYITFHYGKDKMKSFDTNNKLVLINSILMEFNVKICQPLNVELEKLIAEINYEYITNIKLEEDLDIKIDLGKENNKRDIILYITTELKKEVKKEIIQELKNKIIKTDKKVDRKQFDQENERFSSSKQDFEDKITKVEKNIKNTSNDKQIEAIVLGDYAKKYYEFFKYIFDNIDTTFWQIKYNKDQTKIQFEQIKQILLNENNTKNTANEQYTRSYNIYDRVELKF